MARTSLANRSLGGTRTPNEVKELRESSFELHEELGFPVVHKHRWNEQDLAEGLVQRCPLHDNDYDRDLTFDPVCFGTGYVGGFSDPTIVFVTLQDTMTDTIKISSGGVLVMDQHPQLTAPWTPEMGDGDLVIEADFHPGTWEVSNLHDRYELREVQPITMRGPGFTVQPEAYRNRFRISQQSEVDKLPYGHPFYDVPLVFDPSNVPVPIPGITSSPAYAIRIIGGDYPLTSEVSYGVRIAADDSPNAPSSTTRGVSIVGEPGGTHIYFE